MALGEYDPSYAISLHYSAVFRAFRRAGAAAGRGARAPRYAGGRDGVGPGRFPRATGGGRGGARAVYVEVPNALWTLGEGGVWGAGSKAVTFLNIVEGTGAIGHVVDISPDKRGRHIPGTGHRIEAPEEMARAVRRPIEVIAMNPLYRDEIALRLAERGVAARLHAP